VVLHRGAKLTEYDLEARFRGERLALPAPANGAALPVALTGTDTGGPGGLALGGGSLSVEQSERRLLREALIKARGNRTQAAELMGISRRTLHRKLAQWPELDVIDG
jgi:DNA-binding NtrC family response regulator